MTDDFDADFDDSLSDAFAARSGGSVDSGSAHAAVVARANRTRTIRTVGVGGVTVLAVVGGLALLTGGESAAPVPADQLPDPSVTIDGPSITVDDSVAPTSTDPSTSVPISGVDTTASAPETSSAVEADPVTTVSTGSADGTDDTDGETVTTVPTGPVPSVTAAPSGPAVSTASTVAPVGGPAPTSVPASTVTPGSTSAPATTSPPSPPPTSTPPSTTSPPPPTTAPSSTEAPDPSDPPFTRQYDSSGGSITVDWNGSSLSLLSVAPQAGFVAEIEDQSSTRIRVRFRSEGDDSRIEVRAQDGQVQHTVD